MIDLIDNLLYSLFALLLGTIFFTYVVFLNYRKLRSLIMVLLIIFCISLITYTLVQIVLIVMHVFIWLTSIVIKLSKVLFHVSIGLLIMYLDSLRHAKTRNLRFLTFLISVIAILDIFFGDIYIFSIDNSVMIFPKGFLSSIIIASILILVLLYEILGLTKHFSRKFKITGILCIFSIFLLVMNNYLYSLAAFLRFKEIFLHFLQFTSETYFVSGLIFIFISFISIRDLRFITPIEGYGIFITTKLGLKIAFKSFHRNYRSKMSTYASLLATVLALVEGLHSKKHRDKFQVYDTGIDLLIIYYGEKSVCALITRYDNLLVRDIIRKINKAFEDKVGSISDTIVDQRIIELGKTVINSFESIFLG